MNKLWYGLTLLGGLVALTLGCVNKEQLPVFYTLETEEPVAEDRGLPENLSAFRMVNTGSRYFLAAGTLYTRLPGSGSWSRVPAPVSGALCNTIELYDDDGVGPHAAVLYAGWFDRDTGTGRGLWTLDPSLGTWSASDWTQDTTFGDGYRIGLLKAVKPGELLVAASTAINSHVLHYYTGTSSPATLDVGGALISSSSLSIADADWDGTVYWVVAGSDLYSGDSGSGDLTQQNIAGITDKGDVFGGVFYDSLDGDLYVSTLGTASQGGQVLRYAGLTTATSSGRIVDGDPVRFTSFVDVDESYAGLVYVGSEGFGYYVIPVGGAVDAGLTRKPASNISGLYNGAINSFLLDDKGTPLDPSDDSLFVCTSGNGLWRGDYAVGDWIWKQEKGAD
jgi:hypothetical protein